MIDLITGRRELGKTTLACTLAKRIGPSITVDPRFQFAPAPITMTVVDPEVVLFALEAGESVLVQPRTRQEAVDSLAWAAEQYIHADRSRQLTVLFDEAKQYDLASWDFLMRSTRRSETQFILTAHRPSHIPTDIRSIADRWYIFRTRQEHDLKVIYDHCGAEVADQVKQLAPFEYVCWNDSTEEATINRSPAAWYTPLDLSAEISA